MQTNPSTLTSAPAAPRRAWRWWALGAVVLVVVLAAAAVIFPRGSGAPADLDYATTRLSEAGLYRASFALAEPEVPVNKLHTWTLHVETPDGQPVDGAQITVTGDMPEHGHGMPTRPQVTQALGNGDYLVEGMKFQMGGWWVMDFDITVGGQTDRVSFNLMLK